MSKLEEKIEFIDKIAFVFVNLIEAKDFNFINLGLENEIHDICNIWQLLI
ncbi:MAG: hypothetical protein RR202_08085 [Bacteroidales bacterium]